MDLKSVLLNYGLAEKEADIYLALLHLGVGTSQDISKKTGLLRQTTYASLNKLESMGLVLQTQENNVTKFIPQKPKHLISLLNEKKDLIEEALPDFAKISTSDVDVVTKQFKGLQGIKFLYADFLDSKTEILVIQPNIPEEVVKEHFIQNFFRKRVASKIPIKIIRRKINTRFQQDHATNDEEFREVKVYEDLPNLDFQMFIYDDTLVFIDDINLIGIKITHKMFVDAQRVQFNHFWNLGTLV